MDLKKLLDMRTQMKKVKPSFVRKDIHKKKKLVASWRRPRGLHNKQRLKKKGNPKGTSSGYRAPTSIRGVHKSGLAFVIISNLNQLGSITKEKGIILSSALGSRKRLAIVTEIKKRGLVLLNLDADKTLAKIESKIKERQDVRKKKLERRKEKEKKKGIEEKVMKEEAKKEEVKEEEEKKKEIKKEKEELTDEEKKKLEKQEKDKILTKKT